MAHSSRLSSEEYEQLSRNLRCALLLASRSAAPSLHSPSLLCSLTSVAVCCLHLFQQSVFLQLMACNIVSSVSVV